MAPDPSGWRRVVGADDLVAVGHRRPGGSGTGPRDRSCRPNADRPGHPLHASRGDVVGHGRPLVLRVARDGLAMSSGDAVDFGQGVLGRFAGIGRRDSRGGMARVRPGRADRWCGFRHRRHRRRSPWSFLGSGGQVDAHPPERLPLGLGHGRIARIDPSLGSKAGGPWSSSFPLDGRTAMSPRVSMSCNTDPTTARVAAASRARAAPGLPHSRCSTVMGPCPRVRMNRIDRPASVRECPCETGGIEWRAAEARNRRIRDAGRSADGALSGGG